MGTASSGRAGGNPELQKHQYKAKGDEPLIKNLQIKITPSMMEYLKSMGKGYHEFVRQAISEKIERENL
ncbi:hypothetical protein [Nodularia sphaerocarpa]|uniref:hypothetical protein n=1 Tax=Nodularia sphaerocarpa TaxID=137816 RepID=UPI0023310360|nr:hypothetical protein [Nodularia sphaerocarpa]MDB9372379.1 hypothetical protein [Nodularia sphaerocarpa CS-585]MDB9377995.1 hypothetical protein [Nodularia sphaerocarpa CS-585A2]